MVRKITMWQSGMHNPILNSRGMALVLCLLLISTLCLVGGAALGISELNHQIVHNGTKQAQAFYVAEAGRELALAYLREDPMWRGGEAPSPGDYEGGFSMGGVEGIYQVSLSDCTADENGIYSALLPPGHVVLESTGSWVDAVQTVTCMVRVTPKVGAEAAFPQAAVVSGGPATGPLTIVDDLGDENTLLLKAPAALPEANASALKSIADMAFSSLDNDAWDSDLCEIDSFWLDPPANTRPRILYIEGDLEISGARQLYGIVFVEGRHIALDEAAGVQGVLYAPNATSAAVWNTADSGRIVVSGELITGSAGVTVSGNQAAFQHVPDYVDAFNTAAGSKVIIDMVPGSWTPR